MPAAKARVFKQLVDEFLERVKAEELQDADPDLNWQIGSSKVERPGRRATRAGCSASWSRFRAACSA